jgi:hypothetical protein
MPYIIKSARINFNKHLDKVGPEIAAKGDLNYCVTHLALHYIKAHGKSYTNISEAASALVDAADEIKRRLLAPYENQKIDENGDLDLYHELFLR